MKVPLAATSEVTLGAQKGTRASERIKVHTTVSSHLTGDSAARSGPRATNKAPTTCEIESGINITASVDHVIVSDKPNLDRKWSGS